ncbi:MAG: LuxR C-terminal-related transcriptional regulator, partial [Alkalispirochaeta sp.]
HPERPRVEAYHAAALALVSGEYERAYHILTEDVSPSALESIDATDSLRARAFIAYLSLRRSSFAEAYEALEKAEDLLRSHPDPVAESIVVGTRYELARLTGELGDAWELLLRRRIIDEEIGDPYLLAETFLRLGRLSVKGGDWPRARSYFSKAIERRQGDPITLANLVTLETLVGNREEAQAHLDLLLKDAEQQERGPHAVFVAAASGLIVTALLPDTATGTAADTGVDEHRLLRALRIVERARGGAREHPFIAVRRLVLSAVISYYLDRRNKSEELLHELTHVNHFNTIDHGHIERATGLLHYLRGSPLEGAAALRRAAFEFQQRGDLPHALLVESEHLLELAGVDPNEAAPRIEHTLSVCGHNGMDGLAQFIRRQAAKRPAQQRGPSTIALSRREEEVLRLLAAGLRDKEIAGRLNISIHTASNHVRHILAKSDSNNRTQAVARLLTDSPEASQ